MLVYSYVSIWAAFLTTSDSEIIPLFLWEDDGVAHWVEESIHDSLLLFLCPASRKLDELPWIIVCKKENM